MQAPSPQLLRALRSNLYADVRQSRFQSTQPLPRSHWARHQAHRRLLSTTPSSQARSPAKSINPKLQTHDRGPPSREDTQTDFQTLDIYSNTTPPATTIDACLPDGFHLNNGLKTASGDGVFLLGGETFAWRPWGSVSTPSDSSNTTNNPDPLLSKTGVLDLSSPSMFGLLSMLHPPPDLLILGTGASTRPVTKQTRALLASMGVKVDVMDTRNAAASFNLLSTERGVEGVAAAMLPVGWKGR